MLTSGICCTNNQVRYKNGTYTPFHFGSWNLSMPFCKSSLAICSEPRCSSNFFLIGPFNSAGLIKENKINQTPWEEFYLVYLGCREIYFTIVDRSAAKVVAVSLRDLPCSGRRRSWSSKHWPPGTNVNGSGRGIGNHHVN